MANPVVTITDAAGAKIADAVALGADGKVAVTSAVALGAYTAVVSSDNFKDVTVSFAYPSVAVAEIGGAKYWYFAKTDAALALLDDAAKTDAALQAAGWANIAGSDVWYQVAPGSTALPATGYGMDTTTATSYSALYNSLIPGGAATAEDYDAISSATGIVGNAHYGQLSKLVAQDIVTDAKAIKAGATEEQKLANKIVGAYCTPAAIDGADNVKAYVEASILQAAGKTLTDAQTALLKVRLNGNATVDPATVTDRVAVDTVTASGFYTGSSYFDPANLSADKSYGELKLVIRPMAGANSTGGAAFSWADYYASLYAGTISNGEVTVGMAPWIDLYAEGGHSAVEMSIANGKNIYNNTSKATVNRFSAFYDSATGRMKPGNYTVTLYAAGYNNLTYEFKVGAAVPSADANVITFENADVPDGTTVVVESYGPQANADGKTIAETGKVYAENAVVKDGKIELAEKLPAGSYRVQTSIPNAADATKFVTYTFDIGSNPAEASAAAIEAAKWAAAEAAKTACEAAGIEYDASKSAEDNLSAAAEAIAAAKSEAAAAKAEAEAAKTEAANAKTEAANAKTAATKAQQEATAAKTAATTAQNQAKAAQSAAAASVKANTMTVKANKITAKAKKKTTVAGKKAFAVKKAQGKVTYYKVSGNAKIAVNAKNGKVTVKKGLKKNKTYKAKVLVVAAGNKSYAPATKTVTLSVMVK